MKTVSLQAKEICNSPKMDQLCLWIMIWVKWECEDASEGLCWVLDWKVEGWLMKGCDGIDGLVESVSMDGLDQLFESRRCETLSTAYFLTFEMVIGFVIYTSHFQVTKAT